jgi:protein involved in polysaccharide export with SLBB domain
LNQTVRVAEDGSITLSLLGKVEVKGKEEPQEAYELIRTSDVKTKIEAAAVAGLTKFVGRRREMELYRRL